ncbi:Dihydrofolate reductase type 3 [Rubripirellula obstinata]|uniref:Dihydrofolate reductase n=1 Tax=Rubripirellula obstinata TaxID=406547 RepID=A0A5B1CHU0_9BACT|nr:dihydrofolate reductase [Rubripirellula obstinata]KAA1259782.1 Dihydrofolate reductase type 3 [Rubripirellula obstinata]
MVKNSSSLTAIVAMTPSGVIGLDGDMPWRLSSDLRRFKKLTMGGTLIMGRKTYDSIGRPLPGRRTIVITRSDDWSAEGVDRAASPDEAVTMAGSNDVFVVGGAEIYRQLLTRCDQILLTRVLSQVEGDTHLELDLAPFRVVEQTRIPASEKDDVPTEFVKYVRS